MTRLLKTIAIELLLILASILMSVVCFVIVAYGIVDISRYPFSRFADLTIALVGFCTIFFYAIIKFTKE